MKKFQVFNIKTTVEVTLLPLCWNVAYIFRNCPIDCGIHRWGHSGATLWDTLNCQTLFGILKLIHMDFSSALCQYVNNSYLRFLRNVTSALIPDRSDVSFIHFHLQCYWLNYLQYISRCCIVYRKYLVLNLIDIVQRISYRYY